MFMIRVKAAFMTTAHFPPTISEMRILEVLALGMTCVTKLYDVARSIMHAMLPSRITYIRSATVLRTASQHARPQQTATTQPSKRRILESKLKHPRYY